MLELIELWWTQNKFQTRDKAFIVGEPIIDKDTEEMRFPKDIAAGVGIILSQVSQQKVLTFGSVGERVCYVRLEGPVCNLFIIVVYMPHRDRVCPDQDTTIADLQEALQKAPTSDCIVLLGDLNEQLQANVQGRTGNFTAGQQSPNADKIMQLMQLHELTAANTLFKPKSRAALCTFLQTKRNDSDAHNDMGQHVGSKVAVQYKGKWMGGRVKATYQNKGHNAGL